jgi:hypothetical protein
MDAIVSWADAMGCKAPDYWDWLTGHTSHSSTILRAIRGIWGKAKCQMAVQYEYEQNDDTF